MAQYHSNAEKLKPLVEQAGFSKEQYNVILKMMEKCSQLRQGSVIRSFFSCMLPDKFELREDSNNPVTYERNGRELKFNPSIVLEVGEELPPATEKTQLEEKLNQAKETGVIE